MEKNRGTVVAVVAALVIAVISLGVAFAAFAQNLTIGGNATVQASNWNIFWDEDATGEANTVSETHSLTASSTSASLTATAFTFSASLRSPGDYVIYDFYARNEGSFNAKVSSISNPTITSCTYATAVNDSTDATSWCNTHVKWGIYKNDTCTQAVEVEDALLAGGNAHYWVKIWLDSSTFAEDGSDLPSSNVTVNPTTVTVTYAQDGSAVSGQ